MTGAMDVMLEELVELDDHTTTFTGGSIPSATDLLAMGVAQRYLELDEAEQREVRGLISEKLGRFLLAFSGRLAVLAVRRKDPTPLFSALALHAMEDFQFDVRENIIVFALIGDACQRVGLSLDELWNRVGGAFSSEHQEFAAYARSPRGIRAMGLKAVVRNGELDYVPIESG